MFSLFQQIFQPKQKQSFDNIKTIPTRNSINPMRVQVWENKTHIKTITPGKPLEVYTISQFK